MKQCPKCKESISNTAKFCIKCGFNIKKHEEENSNYFCPECGTKFSGGKFCPECGYNIEGDLNSKVKKKAKVNFFDDDFRLDIKQDNKAEKSVDKEELCEEYRNFEIKEYSLGKYVIVKYLDIYELNVVIPKNTIAIGEGAFEGTSITNVKLNNGLKIIGKRAFANCKHLEKINIPSSLDRIDDEAFCDCEKLQLSIPDTVSIIGKNLYYNPQKYVDIFNEGIKLFESKNYDKAFKAFVKASEKGDVDNEYYLGLCYYKGLGVKQDYNNAYEWFKKGADKNQALAIYDLSVMYENGLGIKQDYEKAYELALKAANMKVEEAYYRVGYFLHNGLGVKKDYKKAYEFYLKAAKNEHPLAIYNLGLFLEAGLGVKQDKKAAVEWLIKAANYDIIEAEYLLGKIEEEQGEYFRAYDYYLRAANKNHPLATYKIATFYDKGLGIESDYDEAIKYRSKAANLGIVDAMYELGEHLQKNKEEKKAYEWYLKAAKQNHIAAMANVARFLEQGIGIEKDYQNAYKWYLELAKNNDADYEYKVGYFLEKGLGVKPNYEEAYKWYFKACDKGHLEAINKTIKMQYYGYGVKKTDYSLLKQLANKLLDLGYEYAYCILGRLEEINGNDTKASELYYKALHLPSGEAQYHMGRLEYINGRYSKAIDWFKIAKNKKNPWAYVKQSEMYLKGEVPGGFNRMYNGFSSNQINAIALAQDAARLGFDKGQKLLGEYYYNGIGAKKNIDLAFKYMELAAEQGDPECEYYYGEKLASTGYSKKDKNMLKKGIYYLENAASKLSKYERKLQSAKEWLNKLNK